MILSRQNEREVKSLLKRQLEKMGKVEEERDI